MKELGKVLEVRTLQAIQYKGKMVGTSISADVHKAVMELHPAGVYVYCWDVHLVIPYSNVAWVRCEGPKTEAKK